MKPISKSLKSVFDTLTYDQFHAVVDDNCSEEECKVHNPFIKCPCCKKTFRYKWVENSKGEMKKISEIK